MSGGVRVRFVVWVNSKSDIVDKSDKVSESDSWS